MNFWTDFMARIGYFLSASRDLLALEEALERLKKYELRETYTDYVGLDYKIRFQLNKAISTLKNNDYLVVDNIICLGTTIREISSNLRSIQEKNAKVFVINKENETTYGTKHHEYIIAAHNLLLHLSRHRERYRRKGIVKKRSIKSKTAMGRPPKITIDTIIDARTWIDKSTSIYEIMDRYQISRSSAYGLKNKYNDKYYFDREKYKFLE